MAVWFVGCTVEYLPPDLATTRAPAGGVMRLAAKAETANERARINAFMMVKVNK